MRYARPRTPAGHVESPAAIRGGCTALGLETSSFALCATEDKSSRPSRRIRRALSGSTCPPDTNAAFAAHKNALTGFTKEDYNIVNLRPLIFVYVRVPRRWLSCRGNLTRTEGRDGAETTGEGRQIRAISVKSKEPHCDLQATASTRRLKRR